MQDDFLTSATRVSVYIVPEVCAEQFVVEKFQGYRREVLQDWDLSPALNVTRTIIPNVQGMSLALS